MKPLAKTKYSTYKLLAVLIFTLSQTPLNAQDTKVLEIMSGGERIDSALVNVTLPNQRARDISVRVGSSFPSGTKITTSGTTELKLEANNNRQEIGRNTIHILEHVTLKEHSHKTLDGMSMHYHNNKSVRYKASGKVKIATTRGTVFSVAVDGNTELFQTVEGQITTIEETKLVVKQDSKNNASKKDRPLTTGKTTYVNAGESIYFDGSERIDSFESYDQALAVIQQQVSSIISEGNVDYEQIANEYMLLGELFLDKGNDTEAIRYFTTAIGYLYELEFTELSIAEGYLLLAEVYYMTEDEMKVKEYANNAIDLIGPILELDKMEYQWAKEDGDYELMGDIAYDLFDEYDYLGWAYELMEDDDTADYYYEEADKLGVGY